MEVFLKGVPPDLNDDTLEQALRPSMNRLGLQDWIPGSPRRKDFGFIYFLHEKDGTKFLAYHNPFVVLLGKSVRVSKSKKKPDALMLQYLRETAEERLKSEVDSRPGKRERVRSEPVTFGSHIMECGQMAWEHAGRLPSFIQHAEVSGQSEARFESKRLVIEHQDLGSLVCISYATIVQMVVEQAPSRTGCVLTLVLTEAPRMYRRESTSGELELVLRALQNFRISPTARQGSQKDLHRLTLLPELHHHAACVSQCLVYRIFPLGSEISHQVNALRKCEFFPIAHATLGPSKPPRLAASSISAISASLMAALDNCERQGTLRFSLLFAIQAMAWNNYLPPDVVHAVLLLVTDACCIARTAGNPAPISAEAMTSVCEEIPYPCPDAEWTDFDPAAILQRLLSKEKDVQARKAAETRASVTSSQTTPVFKAMVTPTRITLHGPEPEASNRILRKYPNHVDNFLRVQFSDESGDQLSFSPTISHDQVLERFRDILIKGIKIAGRLYSFLGFSHSSLRSQSAWFCAPFVDESGTLVTPPTIIRELGNFEDIRIPAKCAARIGQAFTETPFVISLTDNRIAETIIPDIKSPDGRRIFSDGVGTISQEALEAIWPYISNRHEKVSTCLQIRWAGVKGMLSLDTRLKGRVINFRESMLKFHGNDTANLEICDHASRPLRMMLNRSLITIMEDMGVSHKWFMGLQKREIDRLRTVTRSAYNASTFLQLQGVGTDFYLSTFIRSLDKYGIDFRQDHFMKGVVEAVVLRELRILKHKARLHVRKGVTLFGILDETAWLQEGEVYVCYDSVQSPGVVPIEDSLVDGPVLVTRSPALNPGDIQIANQRTPPPGHPLRALRNCIVFNQKGNRDLPSMLSGGDLDGDLFNIIWDPAVFPVTTFPPADYPRVTPQLLDRQVTREDMANWFVDFMESDILGMIATRHLVVTDRDELFGTASQDAIKLAELHSTAVDFSKSGIPVNPRDLPKTSKPRPDFMSPAPPTKLYDRGEVDFVDLPEENAGDLEEFSSKFVYYKSKKILGLLYRNIDEKLIWKQDIHHLQLDSTGPTLWEQFAGLMQRRIEDHCAGQISWQHREDEAQTVRAMYDDMIQNARYQFSDDHMKPLTETEVFCGSVFNRRGAGTRRQREASKKLRSEFARISALIVSMMRQDQLSENGPGEESDAVRYARGDEPHDHTVTNKNAVELSYACFMVTFNDLQAGGPTTGNTKTESFIVLAASVFLKELTEFVNRIEQGGVASELAAGDEDLTTGAEYVSVANGAAMFMQYGKNPWDVGQLSNYGFSLYL